jgi:hypothetical protein
MGLILLVVILLLVFAAMPHYPYSRAWGYAPSGGLGLLLVIVLILALLGSIPWYGWRHPTVIDRRPVIIDKRPIIVNPPAKSSQQSESQPP